MKKSQAPPALTKERVMTDKSLTAEREKTDESIIDALEKTEIRTDDVVAHERAITDKITDEAQKASDAVRDKQKAVSKPQQKIEQKKMEDQMQGERTTVADALIQERNLIDVAISKEREIKNTSLTDLLEDERGSTDHNLESERMRTDSEAIQAKNLLKNEIGEHSKTKTSLTTRDEFVAIFSHDLRNPLGAIASSVEILNQNSEIQKDPVNKRLIEIIKRNADMALRLISDILEMETIAEGKFKLKLEPTNVNELIQDAVDTCIIGASAKKVMIKFLPSEISGKLECDHDRILQVLSNLLGNAIKFTQAGGTIIVSVSQLENGVRISVRDNGPGIPEDKLSFIFNRFSQLGTKNREGLGLGLYISKMLIEAHSGKIWVESKVGEGSIFYFSIPKNKSAS